jgi:PPP family 3-phenylpropionic acid transporter
MHEYDKQTKRLATALIVFQILSFAALVPMNYHNVYLTQIGFTSQQIGLWGSVCGIVAMVTLPLWGIIADKTRSGKLTFVLSMLLYGLLYLLMPLAGKLYAVNALPMFAILSVYGTIKQSTRSLQDAWFVSTAAPFGINYASLRMWGAAGFAVLSVIVGFAVDYTGVPFLFYLTTALCVIFAVACLRFREPEPPQDKQARIVRHKMRPWTLLRNYYYVSALIMVFTLATYHALTLSFYPYILQHAGVNPDKVGIITGYGAFVQAVLMLLMTRFGRNTKAYKWLIFAGIAAAAENIIYAVANGMGMLMVAGTLCGIEVGINVSVLPRYVFSIVPQEYATTAQTFDGTVVMLLCVVGNVVAGYVIAAVGISAYNFGIAAIQLLLTALFAASIPFGARMLKKTPPWENQA